MIKVSNRNGILLAFVACLMLAACGDQNDTGADEGEYQNGDSSAFDESQLPDDFPRQLIPEVYSSGVYAKLDGIESVSFESDEPVEKTIERYNDLLGDPALRVSDDGSKATAQWRTPPWEVSVIGNEGESIVGFSRITP